MTTNIFYLDEQAMLEEVFKDHCELSCEEFENIRSRYINLVAGVQEFQQKNPDFYLDEILADANALETIIGFLQEIRHIDMWQQFMLKQAVNKITEAAVKAAEV